MFKLLGKFLFLVFSILSINAFATTKSASIDFSGLIAKVDPNVNWIFYNRWLIGAAFKVSDYPGTMRDNKRLKEIIDHPRLNVPLYGIYTKVTHIGLTDDFSKSYTPVNVPDNCLVFLKDNDTLYVSGILYVPGNNQDPYIENLQCHLN